MGVFKKISDELLTQITYLGGVVVFGFVMVILLSFGFVFEFLRLALGLVASYFLIVVIRSIYFVNRPLKQEFSNFIERLDASSFPSNHSIRIVLLSLILLELSSSVFASVCIVLIVLLVFFSRWYLKKHFLVDILAGAFLGAIIHFGVLSIF
jgi:membrane-associated phospholipid phosphatase